jgi:hypothetical protein
MDLLSRDVASVLLRVAVAAGALGACASISFAQQASQSGPQLKSTATASGTFTTCPVHQSGTVGQGVLPAYDVSVPAANCSFSFQGSVHYKVASVDAQSGPRVCARSDVDTLPAAESALRGIAQKIAAGSPLEEYDMQMLYFIDVSRSQQPAWQVGMNFLDSLQGARFLPGFTTSDNMAEGDIASGQSIALHYRCLAKEQLENVRTQSLAVWDWADEVFHSRGINLRAFLRDRYQPQH